MKRIALSVLIVLILSAMVSAVPDSVITGPYKVSFDLGLKKEVDYWADSTPPIISEALSGEKYTEYPIYILSKKGCYGKIQVKNMEEKLPIVDGPTWNLFLITQTKNDPRISNFNSAQRTIDGVASAVASLSTKLDSGDVVDSYWAVYQPLFDPTHTNVDIVSTFPWDEGTLQLLKTIHVEKVS